MLIVIHLKLLARDQIFSQRDRVRHCAWYSREEIIQCYIIIVNLLCIQGNLYIIIVCIQGNHNVCKHWKVYTTTNSIVHALLSLTNSTDTNTPNSVVQQTYTLWSMPLNSFLCQAIGVLVNYCLVTIASLL